MIEVDDNEWLTKADNLEFDDLREDSVELFKDMMTLDPECREAFVAFIEALDYWHRKEEYESLKTWTEGRAEACCELVRQRINSLVGYCWDFLSSLRVPFVVRLVEQVCELLERDRTELTTVLGQVTRDGAYVQKVSDQVRDMASLFKSSIEPRVVEEMVRVNPDFSFMLNDFVLCLDGENG